MKLLRACVVLVFICAFSACSLELADCPQLDTGKLPSIIYPINGQGVTERQTIACSVLSESSFYAVEGMTVDLPEAGLMGVVVRKIGKGQIADSEVYPQAVYILGDYRFGQNAWHDTFLAVVTGDKVLFYEFGDSSLDDFLYLCDIDGDGLDEIVIHRTLGMSGGAGQFESYVLKVNNDEILEMLRSAPDCLYDTGFSGVFKDGYKMEISNRFSNNVTTIDLSNSNEFTGVFFDESGKVINDFCPFWLDSFYLFEPKDIDTDGIFEIACIQYASLSGHANAIGEAKSIIRFEIKTKTFEVISAEFLLL